MSIIGHDIESFKSAISRRGGVARQNYFLIYMQTPLISINTGQIISNLIGGNDDPSQIFNDPRDVAFLCNSCTLPGRAITSVDYSTWHHPIKMPYGFNNEDITFSFILTQDYYAKRFLDDWQGKVMDFENNRLKYKDEYTSDVNIVQLNSNGTPIYSVKLLNAYPIAVNAIELATASENTVQQVTSTFAYDNFREESITDLGKSVGEGLLNSVTNAFDIFNF